MLVHVRTHAKEKPHQCRLCEKGFSRAENLKIDIRPHSGEKPYCVHKFDELLNYKEDEPLDAINNANINFICTQTPSSSSTTSSSTENNLANTSVVSSPSSDSAIVPVKFLTQRILNKQNSKLPPPINGMGDTMHT
ncbi:zinc finger protein 582-like, partial [Glossina fuscipes]|uniref:Zinc finger protein 582-like n=1 Tax=Glossina fuscipes TaxID=7396 RepID=A0A9C5ZN25_9MUSC